MTISALVITLTSDAPIRSRALATLLATEALTLGEPNGARVPAVLETSSLRASRDVVEGLQATPGIQTVDVVQVHFEDEVAPEATELQASSHGEQARVRRPPPNSDNP
jgi:hypothetical protein